MPTSLAHRSCLLALLALGACSWLCPDPSCPNPPQSEALVPEAKHRITVKTLDDAALTRAVCLVQANDGPACEAGVDPPVCDKRPAGEVRAKLKPAFDVLRDYKFTSATVAAADIPKRLPASWATTAVHDARRNKDCASREPVDGGPAGGGCIGVRFDDLWLVLRSDATGAITSVDLFASRNLCVADIK